MPVCIGRHPFSLPAQKRGAHVFIWLCVCVEGCGEGRVHIKKSIFFSCHTVISRRHVKIRRSGCQNIQNKILQMPGLHRV